MTVSDRSLRGAAWHELDPATEQLYDELFARLAAIVEVVPCFRDDRQHANRCRACSRSESSRELVAVRARCRRSSAPDRSSVASQHPATRRPRLVVDTTRHDAHELRHRQVRRGTGFRVLTDHDTTTVSIHRQRYEEASGYRGDDPRSLRRLPPAGRCLMNADGHSSATWIDIEPVGRGQNPLLPLSGLLGFPAARRRSQNAARGPDRFPPFQSLAARRCRRVALDGRQAGDGCYQLVVIWAAHRSATAARRWRRRCRRSRVDGHRGGVAEDAAVVVVAGPRRRLSRSSEVISELVPGRLAQCVTRSSSATSRSTSSSPGDPYHQAWRSRPAETDTTTFIG